MVIGLQLALTPIACFVACQLSKGRSTATAERCQVAGCFLGSWLKQDIAYD
jgi:hypothetical protein